MGGGKVLCLNLSGMAIVTVVLRSACRRESGPFLPALDPVQKASPAAKDADRLAAVVFRFGIDLEAVYPCSNSCQFLDSNST